MFNLDFLQDRSTRNVILLVAVIVLYYVFVGRKHEGFSVSEADSKLVLEKRMSEEEIPIKPAYVDADVRTLMAGSGFIPQHQIDGPFDMESNVNKYGIVDGLDDGAGGSLGLNYNLVSPACCSEQWPTPFKLAHDKFVCENKDQFVPSPYMGNNAWQNSGCVCMTKSQGEFLTNRGGNA